MHGQRDSKVVFFALAMTALFLSGCEDQEARTKADSAAQEIGELKNTVNKLRTDLDEAKSQMVALRASLAQELNTRMDKIQEAVSGAEGKLRDEFMRRAEDTSKDFQGRIKVVQGDFDARLTNILQADLAKSLEDIRKEVAKNREELLGFMDKQLKELYPYAYQPRRVDPNEPPKAPQP